MRGRGVFGLPGFAAFWAAETVSGFGSAITALALQVLVVVSLHGSASDVGLLNAARWLPYLLLGLVAGALVDRRPRKPVLVATDVARGLLLGAIPALWLAGWLSLPVLLVFVALFGVLSVVNDAASQSFLPRLAPPLQLLAANARLDQGATAAQTGGPAVAGALIGVLGAPIAVLVDAATFLISAATLWRIRVVEPPPAAPGAPRHLGREIGEGLAWVYRHRMLAPLALSTHGWFLCNSMLLTVLAPFALLQLHLTPFELGVALAAAGAAGFAGSLVAAPLGARWGAGWASIAGKALTPVAWAVIALAPAGGAHWISVAVVALGQALYGFSMNIENANSMGYRQAVTPDALQGRMNTTMRSINRAMNVVGAPLGGLMADSLGYRPTFWIAIAGFSLAALYLAASPFRRARHDEAPASAG